LWEGIWIRTPKNGMRRVLSLLLEHWGAFFLRGNNSCALIGEVAEQIFIARTVAEASRARTAAQSSLLGAIHRVSQGTDSFVAKVYIVSFRSIDDRRPSKFIVLANNMRAAIHKAWGHGPDFQSRFDKSTAQPEQMKEGALRVL
jgi:hypothetical protein